MNKSCKILFLVAVLIPTIEASSAQNVTPYTLPWQLRSVMPATAIRLDSAVAFYDDNAGNSGGTVEATVLTGTYKIFPNFTGIVRLPIVNNSPPASQSGISFANPLISGAYSLAMPNDFRLGFSLGMTIPIGMGSGDSPKASTQSANAAAVLARSAMDNSLFAVNYLAIIPGLDIAYIAHRMTVQAEATLFQLQRVQGSAIDKDSSRTNFTCGLSLGYAATDTFFLNGELRYQRWINNDTVAAASHPATQNLSFAIGPRFSFKSGPVTLKPGIAYAMGLAGPIATGGYTSPTNSDKVLFLDIPIVF